MNTYASKGDFKQVGPQLTQMLGNVMSCLVGIYFHCCYYLCVCIILYYNCMSSYVCQLKSKASEIFNI